MVLSRARGRAICVRARPRRARDRRRPEERSGVGRVGHAGDRAAGGAAAAARRAGCARWSPSSCSCGRSSRTPSRAVFLEQPGQTPQLITYPTPEPDPERPVLFDAEVQVAPNVDARIVVRRAKEPLSQGFSRATRRGGLVIRSGRAAHETTLASFEGRPGARHLYGEVFCEAIEQLQRSALDRPRPDLVVKVDRSGLNEHHPIVGRLYQAIDRVLRPIVQAEERRAGAHLIGAPKAVTARDQVGLRALNDLLKAAFEQPGRAAAEPGDQPANKPPTADQDGARAGTRINRAGRAGGSRRACRCRSRPGRRSALWFKQSPVRLHPGEKRTVTLLADPTRVPPGTEVELEADPGLTVLLRAAASPRTRRTRLQRRAGPGPRAGDGRARRAPIGARRRRRAHRRARDPHRAPPRLRLGPRDRPQGRGPD